MTITPYSISESSKISQIYTNDIIKECAQNDSKENAIQVNEAWGALARVGVGALKHGKTALKYGKTALKYGKSAVKSLAKNTPKWAKKTAVGAPVAGVATNVGLTQLSDGIKKLVTNTQGFIDKHPYITAGLIAAPVITYIISKFGDPLIDFVKGSNKISGKEYVISNNDGYLHSEGFSPEISKNIAIFKNKADAENAINALNSVKKDDYKIEELNKVIG